MKGSFIVVWDKFRKIKKMESELDALDALCDFVNEKREFKEVKEEPAIVDDLRNMGSIEATIDLMKMCNPEFVDKVLKGKGVDIDELPDYIYKDLCHDIGKKVLARCRIKYRVDIASDSVKFVAEAQDASH